RITRKPRMFRRPARVLLQAWLAGLMLLLAPLAGASGGLEDDYGLQVREEDRWVASLAMDTTVHMQVHGLLAEVTVRQTYRNDASQWREGATCCPCRRTPPSAASPCAWAIA